jgi:TolB protein
MRVTPFLLILTLWAALIAPVPAQELGEITGRVEAEGIPLIPIAVPAANATGQAGAIAAEIVETIRYDLDFSGYFDVVAPRLYELVPPPEGGEPRYDDWRSIGADALLQLDVGYEDGRIDIIARLYDTPSRKLLFAYRYPGDFDLLRRIAHSISDDLVLHYTGTSGIAKTWIAFSSTHEDGKELYLMDYDGRRIRRLTTTGTLNITPAWSPITDMLAFLSWRGRQPAIYLLDGAGKLSQAPALTSELSAAPEWSPDGRKMVYAADADGNLDLYTLDLASGRNTRLTRTGSIEMAPAYSPNGREIAFTSDRSGTPQIYVMDAEGLNVRRITFQGSYNDSAAWSPDGDKIAYVSRINGRFDVFVYDIPTDRHRRLTFGDGNNENPRWSPDSRHLVFASDRAGTYDIYTMRADGSRVTRLTKGGDCFTPDWSRWSK